MALFIMFIRLLQTLMRMISCKSTCRWRCSNAQFGSFHAYCACSREAVSEMSHGSTEMYSKALACEPAQNIELADVIGAAFREFSGGRSRRPSTQSNASPTQALFLTRLTACSQKVSAAGDCRALGRKRRIPIGTSAATFPTRAKRPAAMSSATRLSGDQDMPCRREPSRRARSPKAKRRPAPRADAVQLTGVGALPGGGRDGPMPKPLCGDRLATDRIRASGHQHPV
jgi:hypothetical protein